MDLTKEDFDPTAEILRQVDVAFVIDCTGSMASYIDEARKHAVTTVASIAAEGDLDVRYGLVAYRDHPPQDNSFVKMVFPFADQGSFQKNLDALSADGGGDGPEAVYDGLAAAATELQWRPGADHRCFLIGDAPPHGASTFGDDGWPGGCPCGATAGGIVELFGAKKIVLHAHSIAGNADTYRAFKEVAEGTDGETTQVDRPSMSTATYGGTMRTASAAIGSTITYSSVSSSLGADYSDAKAATEMGVPVEEVRKTKTYMRSRGLKVREDKE